MTDISDTIKADSTQINAVDLVGASYTYTVTAVNVTKGADQPVRIKVAEDAREYRPSKSMRRVLGACWGLDSSEWVGRRLTLYCDPSVKWAGKAVGGIKVSHASHIAKTVTVGIQESSTQKSLHKVEPLPDAPAAPTTPTPEQIAASSDLGELRGWWKSAAPDVQALIKARVDEIGAAS